MPQQACPNCSKTLKVPETAVGKKIRCPACQMIFVAQAPLEAAIVEPMRVMSLAPAPMELPEVPASPDRWVGKPIDFNVHIKDPDKEYKGQFKAKLDQEGLWLSKKKQEIFLPVGTPAHWTNSNFFEVDFADRRLTLQVVKFGWYLARFTQDVARFLDGGNEAPSNDYAMPWYLWLSALLPIGVPILALGGVLPAMIGASLTMLALFIAQREAMPLWSRLVIIGCINAFAYGLVAVALYMALVRNRW